MTPDRPELVRALIAAVRSVSAAHEKYSSRPREYLDGEILYMREAHFAIAVGEVGQAPMHQLAERMEITPGAVSQLAQRMENKGYVERVTCQEDKRKNLVRLTPKGQQLYEAHNRYDRERYRELAQTLSRYTPEQLALFIDFEETLCALFLQDADRPVRPQDGTNDG